MVGHCMSGHFMHNKEVNMEWRDQVSAAIEASGKLMIFGIGNEMMGDDAAGSLTARELRMLLQGCDYGSVAEVLVAGTNPENFSGVVREKRPDLVIFIDAADMRLPAGEIAFLSPADMHSMMHSTHTMPLSFLGNYLEKITGARIIALGIQAGQIQLEVPMTREVAESVKSISKFLHHAIIQKLNRNG
jgi:hydrogenase 3 maturation protease